MELALELTLGDFAGCKENVQVLQQLDEEKGEKVLFSCLVLKYNKWSSKQERTLLLTNRHLFNIKGHSQVQRKIAVNEIKCITKALQSNDFIIHIKQQYDY